MIIEKYFLSETCYYLQKLVPFARCCTSRNFSIICPLKLRQKREQKWRHPQKWRGPNKSRPRKWREVQKRGGPQNEDNINNEYDVKAKTKPQRESCEIDGRIVYYLR